MIFQIFTVTSLFLLLKHLHWLFRLSYEISLFFYNFCPSHAAKCYWVYTLSAKMLSFLAFYREKERHKINHLKTVNLIMLKSIKCCCMVLDNIVNPQLRKITDNVVHTIQLHFIDSNIFDVWVFWRLSVEWYILNMAFGVFVCVF